MSSAPAACGQEASESVSSDATNAEALGDFARCQPHPQHGAATDGAISPYSVVRLRSAHAEAYLNR
jgi:hypothetical protein